jgi:hypothetical protein
MVFFNTIPTEQIVLQQVGSQVVSLILTQYLFLRARQSVGEFEKHITRMLSDVTKCTYLTKSLRVSHTKRLPHNMRICHKKSTQFFGNVNGNISVAQVAKS